MSILGDLDSLISLLLWEVRAGRAMLRARTSLRSELLWEGAKGGGGGRGGTGEGAGGIGGRGEDAWRAS